MEEGPDFISRLPRDVMLHIVSMIPLKEAVRTASLSNVWRSLWNPFQVKLEFDSAQISSNQAREKLKQLIAATLKSYDYPQKLKFCLEYGDYTGKTVDFSNATDEFLAIVTKGTDRELHFDFSAPESFTSKFNLILEPGAISCPSFSSLKSLQLRFVSHVTEILVKDLFSSCQFLENLSLEKCSGFQNIDIKANDYFKSLAIADCFNIVTILLSAPSLEIISYRGVLPNLELTSTPHLAQVTLNLRDGLGHNCFDCEDVLYLLSSLKDVEILTISGWLLEWLCTSGVIFSRLDFKFNKLKALWWIDSVMDRSKRDSFACFLNMTPALEKLFVKIDPKCNAIQCPFFHAYWHEPHLWTDYATVKCNASPLPHLKVIKLVGFTSKEDELLLMDLLFHMAANLKDMIIISPENHTTWRVSLIPRSQVNYIVSRHKKHMLLSSPNSYSFYVLTEAKDSGLNASNGLCS